MEKGYAEIEAVTADKKDRSVSDVEDSQRPVDEAETDSQEGEEAPGDETVDHQLSKEPHGTKGLRSEGGDFIGCCTRAWRISIPQGEKIFATRGNSSRSSGKSTSLFRRRRMNENRSL